MKAVIGARYRHYKGHEYTILTIARDESDPTRELVIYRAEYESPDFGAYCVWARERCLFEGVVEVDEKVVDRFIQIG